jgi:hypothetical protein
MLSVIIPLFVKVPSTSSQDHSISICQREVPDLTQERSKACYSRIKERELNVSWFESHDMSVSVTGEDSFLEFESVSIQPHLQSKIDDLWGMSGVAVQTIWRQDTTDGDWSYHMWLINISWLKVLMWWFNNFQLPAVTDPISVKHGWGFLRNPSSNWRGAKEDQLSQLYTTLKIKGTL